jgi:hypothetical protein
MTAKKIEKVRGLGWVEMPVDYDPALVTEEDCQRDSQLRVLNASTIDTRYIVTYRDERGTRQHPGCTEEEATFATEEEAHAAIDSLLRTDPATWTGTDFEIEEVAS